MAKNLSVYQEEIMKMVKRNKGKIIIIAEQGLGKNQKPYVLDFCKNCFQMTNHINGICQKCNKK